MHLFNKSLKKIEQYVLDEVVIDCHYVDWRNSSDKYRF